MSLSFNPRRDSALVSALTVLALCTLLAYGMRGQEAQPPALVEVHQAVAGSGPLWYRVGHVRGLGVRWGDSAQYDQGANPAVAQDGLTVVEVHQGQPGVGPLWYRVGQISGDTIQWGQSAQYDNGMNPAVTLQAGMVVEVHQGQSASRERGGSAALWARVGRLTGRSIQWGDSAEYDAGLNPAVR